MAHVWAEYLELVTKRMKHPSRARFWDAVDFLVALIRTFPFLDKFEAPKAPLVFFTGNQLLLSTERCLPFSATELENLKKKHLTIAAAATEYKQKHVLLGGRKHYCPAQPGGLPLI